MGRQQRWFVLILAALTNTLVVGMPAMALSVLLPEISDELGLSLVQAGWVWGIYSMPGIITGLVGGMLGDRFGPRKVLIISCSFVAFLGAFRGFTWSFYSLMIASLMFGIMTPVITMNDLKSAGTWFPNKDLGMASGAVAMGMAAGFMLGSSVSATFLSPWLGGWRNVFLFYGVITLVMVLPWYLSSREPKSSDSHEGKSDGLKSIMKGMAKVIRNRNVWLLGMTALGINGAIQGLLGYLPLYLRSIGWQGANADATLGVLYAASLIFVLPIALGSDRLGSRKIVLIATSAIITSGLLLMAFASNEIVWLAVILVGFVRDGFMAVLLTTIIELKGVGSSYAGTATGFVMIFIGVGSLFASPVGNSFALMGGSIPFLFWALLALVALICVGLFTEEKRPASLLPEEPIGIVEATE